MPVQIQALDTNGRASWQARIAGLEKGIKYPLGEDFFEIDHGANYYAFFDRMGKSSTYLAMDGEALAGVGAIVMRSIPPSSERKPRSCWYICDLKVPRAYRRQHIPIKMFLHGFPRHYPKCPRGYAISMNPGDGTANPVVRLSTHIKLAPVSIGCTLLIYSLTTQEMIRMAPTLTFHRGKFGFLSMDGIKNIKLSSTGQAMPLLHLQFGPCARVAFTDPKPDHIHMFSTPATDPLAEAMLAHGFAATATATVLHHRMNEWDWRFVLTNEI